MAAQFRLLRDLVPPLPVALVALELLVDLVVQAPVVALVDPVDRIVAVPLVLQALPVPQARPAPQAPQVHVRTIFPAVPAVATLPVPLYRVPVFLAPPLVAAVDLAVQVVAVQVGVVAAELVLSNARVDLSVVRRLKS